ncbi:beta-ketoacyl-ACP synthase [Aidingimonas lacisalsi]|uniref:beta-ketoacyl-ACP synthase n=1 Tax=Aidingimonas lacisalsi TaxID=2604086 RepID=UPI0011D1920D|nr:beta-ketoacyl-ACP synthase [Aidingimonas lacisalsi]
MSEHERSASIACRLHPPAIVCSLGGDRETVVEALFSGRRGLTDSDAFTPGRCLPIGQVTAPLSDDSIWPPMHRSRNNRLLATALAQLEEPLNRVLNRYPRSRIGTVIGTSTSGISETEQALAMAGRHAPFPPTFRYTQQELGAPAHFVAESLALTGPAYSLSTACSSSARALASARRLLRSGECDAVIAGGADTLCQLTVKGFASLEAISDRPSLPFSLNRDGINLGEAAALFVMTRDEGGIQLAGSGESADAYHVSAPRPDGSGAHAAMQAALRQAGRMPADIDYLNLHGTGTHHNDLMEARAVADLFGAACPACSSTKGLTGHTLGAAGALEAAFCWLALEHGRYPPHIYDGHYDPELPELPLITAARPCRPTLALSNSFAFGGNNASLLLARTD